MTWHARRNKSLETRHTWIGMLALFLFAILGNFCGPHFPQLWPRGTWGLLRRAVRRLRSCGALTQFLVCRCVRGHNSLAQSTVVRVRRRRRQTGWGAPVGGHTSDLPNAEAVKSNGSNARTRFPWILLKVPNKQEPRHSLRACALSAYMTS